jgi:hypothetical protein
MCSGGCDGRNRVRPTRKSSGADATSDSPTRLHRLPETTDYQFANRRLAVISLNQVFRGWKAIDSPRALVTIDNRGARGSVG